MSKAMMVVGISASQAIDALDGFESQDLDLGVATLSVVHSGEVSGDYVIVSTSDGRYARIET